MKNLIFINSTPKPHEQVLLNQFADSIGADVTHSKQYEPCDVAVILGSWKKIIKSREHLEKLSHHKLKNDIVDNHKGKLIVFETPLLNRKITQEHDSYRVGLNHYMRGLSDFKNKNSPPNRFNSMGIDIKDWRNKGDHILVIGQNLYDASLFGIDLELWLINTIKMLLKNTDRKISGVYLAEFIKNYSIEDNYSSKVIGIIKTNNLEDLDDMKIDRRIIPTNIMSDVI